MNIAIVSAGLSTRSGLRAPIELALALRARGHRVSFYAPSANADPAARQLLESSNITLQTIGSQGRLRQIREVVTKLKAEKPDLISAHCFLLQLLAARLAGPPLIWTYYGTQLDAIKEHYFPRIPFWVKLLNPLGNLFTRAKTRLMVILADEIIPISTAAARDLKRLYGVKPATTIPLGASPQKFKALESQRSPLYAQGSLTILSVSRITPYKGFHTIIEIVNSLTKEFPNLRLQIAGSSAIKPYLQYLKTIAGKNIRFHLDVSDRDLLKLYANADIYITADKYLFFGLPIWEASSLGIPTIALNEQAAAEAVIHGKTGFLASNPSQLMEQLRKLLSDIKLRSRLGSQAKKYAQEHSWSATAIAYETLFQKSLRSYFNPLLPELLRSTFSTLPRRKNLSLADLGTDEGMNLWLLDKLGYLMGFQEIIAVDKRAPTLHELRVKYPNLKAEKADIASMSAIADNHFDLVLCTQVIEHIEDQDAAIKHIKRILKPGGKLFISSVAKKWYGLYWHRNREGKIAAHPDHIHEFNSLSELTDRLQEAGLKILKTRTDPGSLPIFDYSLRLLRVLQGRSAASEHRHLYLTHPRLIRWQRRLSFLPLPGYSIVEALAEKPKKEKV